MTDDTFLTSEGVRDFDRYRVDPNQPLTPDFFVPEDSVPPACVSVDRGFRDGIMFVQSRTTTITTGS